MARKTSDLPAVQDARALVSLPKATLAKLLASHLKGVGSVEDVDKAVIDAAKSKDGTVADRRLYYERFGLLVKGGRVDKPEMPDVPPYLIEEALRLKGAQEVEVVDARTSDVEDDAAEPATADAQEPEPEPTPPPKPAPRKKPSGRHLDVREVPRNRDALPTAAEDESFVLGRLDEAVNAMLADRKAGGSGNGTGEGGAP